MAEAHSAVAFSFSITHEGWDVNFDREVLHLVWQSGIRSWKKRIARFKVKRLHVEYLCPVTRTFYISFSLLCGKTHEDVLFIFFGEKCFNLFVMNTVLLKNAFTVLNVAVLCNVMSCRLHLFATIDSITSLKTVTSCSPPRESRSLPCSAGC
jgi:hypothetical protein